MTHDQSVEERLKNYGDTLDQAIIEIEPRALEKRPSVPWLVAAAAGLVIAGGLFATLGQPSNFTDTGPSQSTNSMDSASSTTLPDSTEQTRSTVPPAPDPQTFEGTQACVNQVGKLEAEIGDGLLGAPFDPATSVHDVVILSLPSSPAAVQVLLLRDEGFIRCKMLRTASSSVSDFTFGGGDPFATPEPGVIRLVDQSWTSGEEAVGPGTVLAIGRVGSDVNGIEIELPDGSSLPGIVTDDGWFSIDGQVPAGVPIFRERINWTTTDGMSNSALADDLRELTPTERCSRTQQCVNDRLDQLLASAKELGFSKQLAVLEDRAVSDEEYTEVLVGYVECLIANNIDAELRQPSHSIAINGALSEEQAIIRETCETEHAELVGEAVELLGVRRSGLGEEEATVFETLQLNTLDGAVVELAKLEPDQQPYFLIFTGSWIDGPNGSNPSIDPARWITEREGLKVYFVATTDPRPAILQEQVRANGIETSVVLLDEDQSAQQLGLRAFPTTFYVDSDGSVAQIWDGTVEPEELRDFLDSVQDD